MVIESPVVPVPIREMASGEFAASLTMEIVPDALPALFGAKSTWKDCDCPAAMEAVDIPPATEKPAPVTVACEIVTAAVPVLLRVRVCGLLDPVATLPKLKVAELAASVPPRASRSRLRSRCCGARQADAAGERKQRAKCQNQGQ